MADTALQSSPNWHEASQSLVNSLVAMDSGEDRIEFLESLCNQLGSNLYPAFIHILFNIEQAATTRAKESVAETLVSCLLSGRLPSGAAPAWGAARNAMNASNEGANTPNEGFARTRRLGPLEYLCAWHIQAQPTSELSAMQFTQALASLIRLIGSNEKAASLYQQHIEHLLSDPVGGAFDHRTHNALQALIQSWSAGHPADQMAERCLPPLKTTSLFDQVSALQQSGKLQRPED